MCVEEHVHCTVCSDRLRKYIRMKGIRNSGNCGLVKVSYGNVKEGV